MLHHQALPERIIGLAIEVHRHLGPGLLEALCVAALCRGLEGAGIRVRRDVAWSRRERFRGRGRTQREWFRGRG